jgi:hypothetical protein
MLLIYMCCHCWIDRFLISPAITRLIYSFYRIVILSGAKDLLTLAREEVDFSND